MRVSTHKLKQEKIVTTSVTELCRSVVVSFMCTHLTGWYPKMMVADTGATWYTLIVEVPVDKLLHRNLVKASGNDKFSVIVVWWSMEKLKFLFKSLENVKSWSSNPESSLMMIYLVRINEIEQAQIIFDTLEKINKKLWNQLNRQSIVGRLNTYFNTYGTGIEYIIELIILQLENKNITTECIHWTTYTVQLKYMRLAIHDCQFFLCKKLFFSVGGMYIFSWIEGMQMKGWS